MPDVSVAILAGGESRRMGTDKALLRFGDQSLIERLIGVASPIADECMVITSSADRFSHLDVLVHRDKEPGLGPLAGLQAALTHARNEIVLLLACDLPFLTSEFLLWVTIRLGNYDAAIPRDRRGRLQPLCAAYATRCLGPVENALASGRRTMKDFHAQVDIRALEPEEWERYDAVGNLFTNVNTPADLQQAVESMKRCAE